MTTKTGGGKRHDNSTDHRDNCTGRPIAAD